MNRFVRRPVAAFLIIVIAVLFLTFWGREGAPVTRVLFSPFTRLFGNTTQSIIGTIPQDVEREALLRKLAVTESELVTLRNEHKELQALARYEAPPARTEIVARVIGAARDPFRQAVFINRGSREGVVLGAPVVVGEGIFVGTVAQVHDHSALILLALDQESRLPAQVLGRDGAFGLLEGHGVLEHLTLVPVEVMVQNGDVVVTGRLGTTVPPGIVIGTVSGVEAHEETPFQTIFVSPFADVTNLSYVSVLVPPLGGERTPL